MSPLPLAAALAVALAGPARAQDPPAEAPDSDDAQPPADDAEPAEPPPLLRLPQLAGFVQAAYPPEARAAGKEAAVRLILSIDASGAVIDVQVVEPVGDGFDEAAVEAARQFRFVPALGEDGPVDVRVEYVYGFSVSGEGASNVAADTPAELRGTLVEMGTRKPLTLQDIYVVAADGREFQLVTDDTGTFALTGLPPGPLKVIAAPSGYETAEKNH
jgi:TonB family C-terminal domain